MTHTDTHHKPYAAQINAYVRSIRNPEKQRYAEDYADWLLHGGFLPDTNDYDLTYMGTQAVRMRLTEIVGLIRPRQEG